MASSPFSEKTLKVRRKLNLDFTLSHYLGILRRASFFFGLDASDDPPGVSFFLRHLLYFISYCYFKAFSTHHLIKLAPWCCAMFLRPTKNEYTHYPSAKYRIFNFFWLDCYF